MGFHKLSIKSFIFLIIPVVTAFIAVHVRSVTTPYFLLNYDPDYAYLFNGLSILDFLAPAHIDHPGTPVQILAAIVVKLFHPFESTAYIIKSVINDPEPYLFSINNVLIALNVIALVTVGIIFHQKTNRIDLGLLVQLSPILFSTTIISLGRVTPEPLLLCISTILTGLIGFTLSTHQETESPKLVKAFGWASGLGITTKLTFLPIIFLPLALFRSIPILKLYLRYLCLASLAFTSVFILHPKHYYSFVRWTFDLFMGTGIYGQGERTIIEPQKFLADLFRVALDQPLYLFIIALALVAFFANFRGIREFHKQSFLLLGLITIHLMAICIVAKHPQSMRYLIPSLGLSGVTLVIAILALESAFRNFKSSKWLLQTFSIAAGVAMAAFSASQIPPLTDELQTRAREFGLEIAKRNMIVEEKYPHCILAHQDSATKTFGVFFGLQWSRQSAATKEFLDTLPKATQSFSYDPNQKIFFNFRGDRIPLEEIKKQPLCIIRLTYSGSIELL